MNPDWDMAIFRFLEALLKNSHISKKSSKIFKFFYRRLLSDGLRGNENKSAQKLE